MKAISKDIEELIKGLRTREPTLGIKKILERLRPRYPFLTAKQIRVVLQSSCLDVARLKLEDSIIDSKPIVLPISIRPETKSVCFDDALKSGESVGLVQIVDLPGKGKGMIAAYDLPAGSLVLPEAPLLAVTAEVEQQEGIAAQVDKLSAAHKEKLFSLHDKDCEVGQSKTAIGIWNTNAIELGLTLQGGVFYHCSRINHSCTPNLHNAWNKAAGVIEMRAVKDIKAGEELNICYTDPLMSCEERKASLIDRYAFECDCAACTTTRPVSDERRARIAKIQNRLQTEGLSETPFRNLKEIREALAMLEAEGLYGLRHEFSDPAYRIVFKLGMLGEAKAWASTLYEHGRINFGVDDGRVKEWQKWTQNPQQPTNFLEMDAVKEFLARAGQLGLTEAMK